MSIVHPYLPGARVLDLFAGTGALGLEALSRGADFVDFVEESARTIKTLEANIHSLGAGDRCRVHRTDSLRFLEARAAGGAQTAGAAAAAAYDVAFADPPYRTGLALAIAEAWLATPFARLLGVEHEAGLALPGGHDVRRYGDTSITFYRS